MLQSVAKIRIKKSVPDLSIMGQKYKCNNCALVVEVESKALPDRKEGGPCPKDTLGQHNWQKKD